MNFFDSIMKPILTNQIIVDWIAPIITGLIVFIIPAIVVRICKSRNLSKKIEETNGKIINTIRPFIIQRIAISQHFISDIRMAIIKESEIKEKLIYTEIEIRNKILWDISETRFLKEKEKQELIEDTYKIFENFNDKQIIEKIDYEELESQENKKISMIVFTIILIISLFIMSIAYIINPVDVNVEDNVLIIITMITAIFSAFSLYMNVLGIDSFFAIRLSKRRKKLIEDIEEEMKLYSNYKEN